MRNKIIKTWKKVRLGEVALINPKVELRRGYEYPYIPMEMLSWDIKYVSGDKTKEFNGGARFENGDILLARITPCLENGKMARVKNLQGGKGFGSTEYFVLRGKEGVLDTDFLFYLLRTNRLRQTLINSMIGASGRQRARIEALKNYEFLLPDLQTQKHIAAILSAFDDKIELNNKINQTLEQIAQAIFKEWFINFRFPGHEKVKFVDSELGKIPEGWKIGALRDLISISSGKRPNKNLIESEGAKIPIVGASGIMGYTNECLISKKILVIGRVGTLGVIQRIDKPCWVSDNALIIETDFYEYVYQVLSRLDYSSLDVGSTQPLITQSAIKKVVVLIPPKGVLNSFENLMLCFRKLWFENLGQNEMLSSLRDLLLPKLMGGEIRI